MILGACLTIHQWLFLSSIVQNTMQAPHLWAAMQHPANDCESPFHGVQGGNAEFLIVASIT
jgi:hypothetical protein